MLDTFSHTCLKCHKEATKVIYMGLPMKLCMEHDIPELWGFWSFIVKLYFNGTFMIYKGIWYPRALWIWLTKNFDEDEDE